MNRHQLIDTLRQLWAVERSSLLRHLDEAPPYLSPKTYPVWRRMRAMVSASIQREHLLTDWLADRGHPTPGVALDPRLSAFHFVDLRALLPTLIEEHSRRLADLDHALQRDTSNAAPGETASDKAPAPTDPSDDDSPTDDALAKTLSHWRDAIAVERDQLREALDQLGQAPSAQLSQPMAAGDNPVQQR